jgi:small nuclear ribonucleoprotein G
MASKQGYGADLKNYVDKNIQINLNGNRKLIGKLRGYDPFMNIVLENAKDISKNSFNNNEEHKTNEDNIKNTEIQALGTVMIRGNSIVYWECLDKIQNK